MSSHSQLNRTGDVTAGNPEQYHGKRALPVTVMGPLPGWVPVNLGELWEYRELLYFLTWREVKVGYKQTLLGFAWAIMLLWNYRPKVAEYQ